MENTENAQLPATAEQTTETGNQALLKSLQNSFIQASHSLMSNAGNGQLQAARADQITAEQTTERDKRLNKWLSTMETLLQSFDDDYIQSCSICIVPEGLKKFNEDAYTPRVVSMGPRYNARREDLLMQEIKSRSKGSREDLLLMKEIKSQYTGSREDLLLMEEIKSRYKGSREDLLLMEEIKLRCMLSLLHRAGKDGDARDYFKDCSKAIWRLESEIRASYAADLKLRKEELSKIMLVDGCFLLELLISKSNELNAKLRSRLDPPGPAPQVLKHEDVLSDLMLLENQIPILVLHELSRTLFPNEFDQQNRLQRATIINNLALSILGYSVSDSLPQVRVQSLEAPHILYLVHSFVNNTGERTPSEDYGNNNNNNHAVDIMENKRVRLKMKRCAKSLQAAGVTIKLPGDTNSGVSCFGFLRYCFGGILIWLGSKIVITKQVDDIPAEGVRGLDFGFKFREGGKLEIAQVHITKTTKAKWRNVIAWEHHRKWCSSISAATDEKQSTTGPNGKFTLAALIFDGLICCAADVKLLKDKNIIVDHVKMSDEDLVAFFRAISYGVDHGVVDSSDAKMVYDLNNYSEAFPPIRICKILWHLFRYHLERLMKFMKQNYHFVATVVTVVTVVQGVYAILAYHLPK